MIVLENLLSSVLGIGLPPTEGSRRAPSLLSVSINSLVGNSRKVTVAATKLSSELIHTYLR